MVTLVILADRMIPTEEIQKVSSRYLDWFRFYEFFFVKNPTNCPIIECVPYIIILKIIARFKFQSCLCSFNCKLQSGPCSEFSKKTISVLASLIRTFKQTLIVTRALR